MASELVSVVVMTSDAPQPTPDTKNWTWVLERDCPDCGFTAASIEREALGGHIRANAARFRELLEHDQVATRPPSTEGEVWSGLEYGAHVRDVYEIYHQRFSLMLNEDGAEFADWDQDASAIEKSYATDNPTQVAHDLAVNAGKLADLLDNVSGDAWQRTGLRSDGSAFTVESMGLYLLHDPVHHVWDVETGYAALEG